MLCKNSKTINCIYGHTVRRKKLSNNTTNFLWFASALFTEQFHNDFPFTNQIRKMGITAIVSIVLGKFFFWSSPVNKLDKWKLTHSYMCKALRWAFLPQVISEYISSPSSGNVCKFSSLSEYSTICNPISTSAIQLQWERIYVCSYVSIMTQNEVHDAALYSFAYELEHFTHLPAKC